MPDTSGGYLSGHGRHVNDVVVMKPRELTGGEELERNWKGEVVKQDKNTWPHLEGVVAAEITTLTCCPEEDWNM